MSTFSGINTALSGLLAYQRAIDITGQNIANVNTPGYHRQRPVLTERVTGALPGGVDVLGVQRADAAYVELQINLSSSDLGRWSAAKGQLEAAQSVLSPAQGQNLGTLLDGFWSAWQGLAAQPDQLGPRTAVQQAASALTAGLRDQFTQLTALQTSINGMLGDTVGEINSLASTIADLNTKIHAAEGAGNSTAELMDTRQEALQRLSQLCGAVSFAPEAAGGAIVTLGGRPLVQGGTATAIELTQVGGIPQLTWSTTGGPVQVEGGEVAGLLQVRDQQIPDYQRTLDQIATTLLTSVNQLHLTGVGMSGQTGAFFTGAGAGDIRLAAGVAADAGAIAAGAAGAPSDGSIADQIASLRDRAMVSGQTAGDVAAGLLARIGGDVSTAENAEAAASAVREQMIQQQQSIAGVSLDEEMTNMMQYQDSYSASSRVLVTMDQMLDELINIIR